MFCPFTAMVENFGVKESAEWGRGTGARNSQEISRYFVSEPSFVGIYV